MLKYLEFQKGLFIFFLYTTYYIFSQIFNIDEPHWYFSIFIYVQFIYVFLSWKKITSSKFDSYILFTIALYVFSLGHGFLDLFNGVKERFSLIESWGVSMSNYINTEYITLTFVLFFHFGALYFIKLNKFPSKKNTFNKVSALYSLKIVGICLFFISFPFYIYDTIQDIKTSFLYGYMGLYDTDNIEYGAAGFYRILSDAFVPSLICLLFYAEGAKRHRFFLYSMTFLVICVPPMFIGSRTNAVIMSGILLLIYTFFNKVNIRLKHILILGLIGYFSVFALVFVRNSRLTSDATEITDVIEQIKEDDSNVVTSIVSEMGWSMYPIVETINIKKEKNESFLLGSSFLWSFTAIMPNLFWDIHPANKYADMSDWITKKLNFSFGIGYSIIAEAYANFGLLGFVFMFFLGGGLVKIFRYSISTTTFNDILLSTVSVIVLWFTIRIVRNNFLDTIRFFGFYILPIFLSLKYIYKKHSKRL